MIPAWLDDCQSAIIYERRIGHEVFYVLPIASILGKLPVVPVGTTGTIPNSMRQSAADFVDAAFDTWELETVAGGGMSTLGHWDGHARRKATGIGGKHRTFSSQTRTVVAIRAWWTGPSDQF